MEHGVLKALLDSSAGESLAWYAVRTWHCCLL